MAYFPDFTVHDDGTIFIVTPETQEAQDWLDDEVITPETLRWGRGIVVEARFIGDLVAGITSNGFTVEEE